MSRTPFPSVELEDAAQSSPPPAHVSHETRIQANEHDIRALKKAVNKLDEARETLALQIALTLDRAARDGAIKGALLGGIVTLVVMLLARMIGVHL